jgi:hypothetical protein
MEPTSPDTKKPGLIRRLLSRVNTISFYGISIKPETNAGKVFAVVLLLLVALASVLAVRGADVLKPRPPVTRNSIKVFLPDWSRGSEGAFYQDGFVQWAGFEQAQLDAVTLPNRLAVSYEKMKPDVSPEELLQRMQASYEEGATFFVMTMSTKVRDLRDHFKKWHDECVRDKKREPILIVTVASAPDLADGSSGILRWYIRSDEEVAVLAAYARWKLALSDMAIFYITRNAGQENDAYGKYAKDLFQERFEKLGGNNFASFGVTASTVNEQVAQFVSQYRQTKLQGRLGVFLVGYGDVFRDTLAALIAKGFDGPIACSSTLTEPDWQPQSRSADARIFTVFPRLRGARGTLLGHDKNVVFFFAKDTLFRVLDVTAADPSSAGFVNRWRRRGESHKLDHDYLADGDAIIRVEVAGSAQWRSESQDPGANKPQ